MAFPPDIPNLTYLIIVRSESQLRSRFKIYSKKPKSNPFLTRQWTTADQRFVPVQYLSRL